MLRIILHQPITLPKTQESSVRHTRAIQRDQSKRPNIAPPDEQVQALLEEVLQPATFSQVAHYHRLGLRERSFNLPVIVPSCSRFCGNTSVPYEKPCASSTRKESSGQDRYLSRPKPSWSDCEPCRPSCSRRFWSKSSADAGALPPTPTPPSEALAWAKQHFSAILALDRL